DVRFYGFPNACVRDQSRTFCPAESDKKNIRQKERRNDKKKYVKSERKYDRTDRAGGLSRFFRLGLFRHRYLRRRLCEIFIERSFGKYGFCFEFCFGRQFFLRRHVVLKYLRRKIKRLNAERQRLNKRRS